jgi:hypothetical protein
MLYVRFMECEVDEALQTHKELALMPARCKDRVLQTMSATLRRGSAMLSQAEVTSCCDQLRGITREVPFPKAIWIE